MTARGLPAFGAARPPHDPRALAHTILAQPRFQIHGPPRETWWDRMWQWIGDVLSRLFGGIHAGAGTLETVGTIVLIAACALVVVAIVRLLLSISGEYAAATPHVRTLQARAAAKHWYDRALQAAAADDYAHAVMLLFRAVLAILDLRGMVHDEPSRTVGESRSELRGRAPQYLSSFDSVARIFTAALYADAPVSRAQFETARTAYDRLFSAVTREA